MKISGNITGFVLGMCLCLSSIAFAQTVTGSVAGTVTDATGSVISGAKVTIHNLATGVTNETVTNGSGIYYVQFLRIGLYKVSFSSPGFNGESVGPFALEIDQVAKIDAKLKVGSASEIVVVSDSLAPILNSENATIASTITSNTIENIPLNGQNFVSLTAFMPGSVNTEPAMSGGSLPSGRSDERYTSDDSIPSFNGNRQMSNNFILDGVEINETLNNTAAYNPNIDALDQVQVITTNASAEFGNANGGLIIAVTKGGTDKFHGSVNGYLENDKLDANTWANKDVPSPSEITPKSNYTHSIFNGTFGGAIKKDKLFFFVDYEGMRYHTGGVSTASVAPAAWRTGDFSDLLSIATPIQLYNSAGTYDAVNGYPVYANNQVPIANPVAKFLFAHPELYPLPNQAPIDGNVATSDYRGNYKQYNRNDQGDARIDWKVNDKDTVWGRFTAGHAGDGMPKAVLPISFPSSDDYPFKGGVVSWTHTLTSSLVNEARAGISRSIYDEGNTTDPSGAFGLNGNKIVGIPGGQTQPGFSFMSFADQVDGIGSLAWMVDMHENNYTYADNINWQKGHHMVKAGVEFIRYQQNYVFPGNSGALGEFAYSGAYTGGYTAQSGSTGTSFADFELDRSSEATVGASYGYVGQRQWRDGVFVQDDWKVTPQLTLNLGVRWEFFQPIYEVNNKELNVNPSTMTLQYAGKDGNSRSMYNATYTNFEPRFGFAYQASPRWVVRGGYGITNYLEGTGTALRLTQNYPFNYSYDDVAAAPSTGSNGAPIQVESGFGATIPATATTTYYEWDKHLKPALTQQFNLTAEYELSSDSSVSAAYVGQAGQHLIDAVYANQWKTIGDPTTAPYQNLIGADGNALGPNGAVKVTNAESKMNYNALQMVFRHRASHGLEYTVNYTYGKAMTNYPGFYGTLGVNGAGNYWQNPYDPQADYGPSFTDIRHEVSATGVYELPFGRGRAFGANWNPVLNQVIGGWKFGTTGTFFTGLPVNVTSWGSVNANEIAWAQRGNQYRKLKVVNRSAAHWFGTDPSAIPCAGADNGSCAYGNELSTEYGTAHTDTERAPGYRQVDTSLFKSFQITEGQKVEFRSDFFNAFNITSLGNPSNWTTWGVFGQITSSRSPQRQIQFALKYIF